VRGYLGDDGLAAQRFLSSDAVPRKRLYRTGDAARWTIDGEIIYHGRKDDQIEGAGNRLATGEIEHKIQQVPGVDECLVMTYREGSSSQIVAYYTQVADITSNLVREQVAEVLPDYMVPDFFIHVPVFSRLANGKVDKKSLPPPGADASPLLDNITRNDVERRLMRIWKDILGIHIVGLQESFFDLGGHSLRAVTMAARIREEFNAEIDLSLIFSSPTIESLAKVLDGAKSTVFQRIEQVAEQPYYDLSYAQNGTWVQCQLDPKTIMFNMPGSFILNGKLDVSLFDVAIRRLIERHESLRTSFVNVEGVPKQKIHAMDTVPIGVHFEDLRSCVDPTRRARELSEAETKKPMDLEKAPLFAVSVYRIEHERFFVSYITHHIVSDGWSSLVLLNDFLSIYNGLVMGNPHVQAPLRIQYKDFSAWQNQQIREGQLERARQYWMDKFSSVPDFVRLPTDFRQPPQYDFSGAELDLLLEEDVSHGVRNLCRDKDMTLFMVLLSGIYALLYRYTQQSDLTIGTPVAGRFHPDLENQIGFYLNAMALRASVHDADTPDTLLRKVRAVTLEAFENQHYPFELMINDLKMARSDGNYSLFNTLMVLNNFDLVELNGLEMRGVRVEDFNVKTESSKFDLSFIFFERKDRILLRVEYRTCLFMESTIRTIASDLQRMLRAFVEEASLPVMLIPIDLDVNRHVSEITSDFTQSINALSDIV
jgi:acyl carrier protein